MQSLDTVVFETPLTKAARFRCSTDDPRFRDCGPAANCAVAFPRTSVWIQYSGSRGFVADPSLATIYNPGQEYVRGKLSQDGDRCEWFGVSPALAVEIAASIDPHSFDACERPFLDEWSPVDRDLYVTQRQLFSRLEKGDVEPLEADETIIGIVAAVLRRARERRQSSSKDDSESRIDLAERARALLASSLYENSSLNDLASCLGVSPYHLCRVFRAVTGYTLHDYKTELRLRQVLEQLGDKSADLSRIAHESGFSSHSHFTSVFRRRFGSTPSQLRDLLS